MRTKPVPTSCRPRGRFSRPLHAALRMTAVTGLLLAFVALPAAAQDVVVEGADGNVWDPDVLEIEAGTTVTFDMVGGDAGHDVAVDGETVISFTPIGGAEDYTFDEPGDFLITCTIHPGMDLALTVTGEAVDGGTDPGDDEAPADDAGDDEEPADEPVEDDAPADAATEDDDTELAIADGDAEDGGGTETALLIAIVAAVVLMVASFGIIRRQD